MFSCSGLPNNATQRSMIMSRENSSLKRKTAIQNIAHLFVVCEVGITLPPIIMEVENGVLEVGKMCLISKWAIFHLHDYERKDNPFEQHDNAEKKCDLWHSNASTKALSKGW